MKFKTLIALTLILLVHWAAAATYTLPTDGSNIVGQLQYAHTGFFDSFYKIGRRYDIGYNGMLWANPGYNPDSLPSFHNILVPSQYVLPAGPQVGIVINLPEMRLYAYLPQQNKVLIFPVGVGKQGWVTPQGVLQVIEKIKNPIWHVPKDIQQELAAQGSQVNDQVQEGPQDPLGLFAMRLSRPDYLIHGTNYPPSIGTRASSGCIRLFPEDIQYLFQQIDLGTPVRIIDQPYKVGWENGKLYLSAFPPMDEDKQNVRTNLTPLVDAVQAALLQHPGSVNWQRTIAIALQHNGIPQIISS